VEAVRGSTLVKETGGSFQMHTMTCSPFENKTQNHWWMSGLGWRKKAMQAIQNLHPANFTIEQLDEELQCMALICTLPDEYCHLSSNLLLVEKLCMT
jgi:hypothetical protein